VRHVRVIEGINEVIESFGYAVGDAEDFIDRERMHMHDLIDGVADGKLSAIGAKREVDLAFSNAAKQIEEARLLLANGARRAGFTHLHPSLVELVTEQYPTARLVVPLRANLPEGA
jgi:hypothetical protein